jgi:hypothetical protein
MRGGHPRVRGSQDGGHVRSRAVLWPLYSITKRVFQRLLKRPSSGLELSQLHLSEGSINSLLTICAQYLLI